MATLQWLTIRDSTSRVGVGMSYDEQHLLIGQADFRYRAFLRFGVAWDGVGSIISASLKFRNSNAAHFTNGSSPRLRIRVLKDAFTEDLTGALGENVYTNPDEDPAVFSAPSVRQDVSGAIDADISIDITDLVEMWAPNTVAKRDGTPGDGNSPHGLRLTADEETSTSRRLEIVSRHNAVVGYRPYIELVYDPPPTAPNAPTTLVPTGNVAAIPTAFTGTFSDPNSTSKVLKTTINLYLAGGDTPIWTSTADATESQRTSGAWSVPIPTGTVARGTSYEWTAQNQDGSGLWGVVSSRISFIVNNSVPTLALTQFASLASLALVTFRGTFSDGDVEDQLTRYRIQLRVQTVAGDPAWDSGNAWDTGWVWAEWRERTDATFSQMYEGSSLTAGNYSWRAMVEDRHGGQSIWMYDDFTLTAAYDPLPGAGEFLTGYNVPVKARVLIYALDGTTRGPTGSPLAIIEDAANLGVGKYMNAPGEFYMTLPATHPQVSVIEPYRVHYAVQHWKGDRYVNRFVGLITDFDATEDDVVFYGIDYLALLSKVVDTRYDPDAPDKSFSLGGSKYVNETISGIIGDILSIARNKSNSPVNFITLGTLDVMSAATTIFSTFAEVLGFVTGLVESHRQGTGKSSQIAVREKAAGGYEFRLLDNPGVVRNNITLRFGELVQGFRLIAFGDFATITHGVGRVRNGIKVFYRTKTADGITLGGATGYGAIEDVRLWEAVDDGNDLSRRVKQAAASAARIGKRVALGIRTDSLAPLDGYDIGDYVKVDITRGVVNTYAYGSGYWTVMGVEWRLYPDGRDETTLVLLPREDSVAPDNNLITSSEILGGREWEVGYGVPVAGVNASQNYVDLDTGITYALQTAGTYVVSDAPVALAAPTGLALTTTLAQDAEGAWVPSVKAALVQPTGDGLAHSVVEVTAEEIAGVPDWTKATKLIVPKGKTETALIGVAAGVEHHARAYSVTNWQQASAPTATQALVAAIDADAPPIPTGLTLVAGLRAFAALWNADSTPDLAFFQLRYRVDPAGSWVVVTALTNHLVVNNLLDSTKYDVQVRSVDHTGNVDNGAGVLNYITSPEAGWCAIVEVTTVLIQTADIAVRAITTEKLSVGQRNPLITNPDFEDDLNGWIQDPGGGSISVEANSSAISGTKSVLLETGASGGSANIGSTLFRAAEGSSILVSVFARVNIAPCDFQLFVNWYDVNQVFVSSSPIETEVLTTVYARYSGVFVAPANAKYGRVYLKNNTLSKTVRVDDVVATVADAYLNDSGTVVIDQSGLTVTGGAITVKGPTGTVIIDGSSDMFKIAATGTIVTPTLTAPGESSTATDIATGLTYRPASLLYREHTGTISGAQLLPWYLVNSADGLTLDGYYGRTTVVNTNETRVRAVLWTSRAAGLGPYTYRYYVLKEVAI